MDEERVKKIVDRWAAGKFVNLEAFSPSEMDQIRKAWEAHPEYPKDAG
jgi:hypothetical protein